MLNVSSGSESELPVPSYKRKNDLCKSTQFMLKVSIIWNNLRVRVCVCV